MKKIVSLLLALTLVCTLFTGVLSAQAADDAVLTVCTQTGEFGPRTTVKTYTAAELKKLAEQYQMELDKVKAAVDTAMSNRRWRRRNTLPSRTCWQTPV